ncbi:MAG TPA: hypothetical protein VFE46_10965 [Pirellulales bacterium]|nr:hypothetical protein [Pirellulales bacterium]
MKHIQAFTRRQIVLIGGGLAVLAAVALVPWRLVAQDAKPPAAGSGQGAVVGGQQEKPTTQADDASAAVPTDKAAREKLLIGTWRGGDHGYKLTFRSDGTFTEFPKSLMMAASDPFTPAGAPGMGAPSMNANRTESHSLGGQGRWQINSAGERLVLTYEETQSSGGGQRETEAGRPCEFKITKLDPTFLRLTMLYRAPNSIGLVEGGTTFYRRLPEVTGLDPLKGKLLDDVLRVAEVAQMDSEEALAFSAWIKEQKIEPQQLQIIEKTTAAKNSKISLQALFGWSDAENKAYDELKKVSGGFAAAGNLAEQNLLSADEKNAIRKMRSFAEDFAKVCSTFESIPRISVPGQPFSPVYPGGAVVSGVVGSAPGANSAMGTITIGPGILGGPMASADPTGSQAFPAGTSATQESLNKVRALLDDLQDWLAQGPLAN